MQQFCEKEKICKSSLMNLTCETYKLYQCVEIFKCQEKFMIHSKEWRSIYFELLFFSILKPRQIIQRACALDDQIT